MISREGAADPAPPSKKLVCSLCACIFWSKFSNIKRPALVIETKTASDFLELITIRCSAIQLLAELAASIPDGKSVQKTCECHNNSKVASTDRATENYLSQVQYLSDIWLDWVWLLCACQGGGHWEEGFKTVFRLADFRECG